MSAAVRARLQGRVALVTGGGRGIGRAIALRCAAEGADVALAARSRSDLRAVAEEVRSRSRRAVAIPTDIRDETAVRAMADQAAEALGPVDVLVANSGIPGPSAPLWEIEPGEWRQTLDVNVTGTYLCCRAVLPGMIESGGGSVVIIGSMTGKRPLEGRSPYAASKLALVGLTRTLAVDAGKHDIRVNLVSPGPVRGKRLEWVIEKQAEARGLSVDQARQAFKAGSPLHRLVDPDDVAQAVVFLASDEAVGITGTDLNVSSGMVMD